MLLVCDATATSVASPQVDFHCNMQCVYCIYHVCNLSDMSVPSDHNLHWNILSVQCTMNITNFEIENPIVRAIEYVLFFFFFLGNHLANSIESEVRAHHTTTDDG